MFQEKKSYAAKSKHAKNPTQWRAFEFQYRLLVLISGAKFLHMKVQSKWLGRDRMEMVVCLKRPSRTSICARFISNVTAVHFY